LFGLPVGIVRETPQDLSVVCGEREMGAVSILVGVDGSAGSEVALRWAMREAALRSAASNDAEQSVVTALMAWTAQEPFGGVLRALTIADHTTIAQAAEQRLESSIARVGPPAPAVELRRIVTPGEPVSALVERAGGADMIVAGTHGHGALGRVTIGCVTQGVLYHASIPVVVTRPAHDDEAGPVRPADEDRRPVVVGVDGSEPSLAALRWAAQAAAVRHVPLRVLHGWGGYDPLYADALAAAQGSMARQAGRIVDRAVELGLTPAGAPQVTVEPVVSSESGVRALLDASQQAQLLVVGSRGLGGFARLLLGSVSHQCVLHAACDIAVIRAPKRPA